MRCHDRSAARAVTGTVLLAIAVGCAADRPAADAPARRIVSLAPSITELLFAIGAGDRLVGRTTWCDYPAAALAVPSVGDGLNPNVETIVARRPDLVLAYASPSTATAVARLRALGIVTDTLRMDRLEDVAAGARRLGRLAGGAARADSLAAAFAAALDSARTAPPPAPRPRVALLAWDQPPVVIGGGSFQHELVTLAGAVNVFGNLVEPSVQVSIEAIAGRDPDLVVLLGATTSGREWATRPEWQAVRAVRERRLVQLAGTEFARPSFRALEAVRMLHAALAEAAR